jgi:hypothetical protein
VRKRLGKTRATTPISLTLLSTSSGVVHELPEGDYTVLGERFKQSWQQLSQASPKLRFGLLGVFLEVDLACLLDDIVIGDLIWELIEGLTGLF